jgi:polysaccharide lyase-like protein
MSRCRRRITPLFVLVALTAISTATAGALGRGAPVNSRPPSISGAAVAGGSLTADAGLWSGAAASYSYKWARCDSGGSACVAVSTATRPDYPLGSTDVGSSLRVTVIATNKKGSTAATSLPTPVVAPAPVLTVIAPPTTTTSPPTISGTTQQGQTLRAASGSWSGTTPLSYTYQWKRCDSSGASCAAVTGATSTSYPLSWADVYSTVRVSVTASNSAGSATASSAATAVVSAPPPPSGVVLKRLDYEYPNATGVDPGVGGWQCADNTSSTGATRGTLSADATTFDSIARSGLFANPATDPNASYGRSACEILMSHVPKTGNNVYYSLALRVPVGWSGHDDFTRGRTLIAGFNYNASSFGHQIDVYNDRAALSLSTGNCVLGIGCDYDNSCGGECWGTANNVRCDPVNGTNKFGGLNGCKIIPTGQLAQGVWHEMIVHVYETPRADGLIEAWWKRKGETAWNKTVTMSGMPTLPLGTNSFGTNFTVSGYDAGSYLNYDKFGLQSFGSTVSTSINQDNNCVATSFDAAASCFN